jgi:hypothetical protein
MKAKEVGPAFEKHFVTQETYDYDGICVQINM